MKFLGIPTITKKLPLLTVVADLYFTAALPHVDLTHMAFSASPVRGAYELCQL